MSLAFLAKKSWHTSNLRNVEKVWIAEQKHASEEKKLAELKKNIEEERQMQELRKLQAAHGNKSATVERLDWMYQGPMASSSDKKTSEDYLLGKEYKAEETGSDARKLGDTAYGALALSKSALPANDAFSRLNEDPMMLIRSQQKRAQEDILKNPVKMKKIKGEVEKLLKDKKDKKKAKKKAKKEAKKERKHSKKSRRDRSSLAESQVSDRSDAPAQPEGRKERDQHRSLSVANEDRNRHSRRSERRSRSGERSRRRDSSPRPRSRSRERHRELPRDRSRDRSSRHPARESSPRSRRGRSRSGDHRRSDRRRRSSSHDSFGRTRGRSRSPAPPSRNGHRDRRELSPPPRRDSSDRRRRESPRRSDGRSVTPERRGRRESTPNTKKQRRDSSNDRGSRDAGRDREYVVKRPDDGGKYGLIRQDGAVECKEVDRSTLGPNTKFLEKAREKKRLEEEELRRKLSKSSHGDSARSHEDMLKEAARMADDAKAREAFLAKRAAEKREKLDEEEAKLSKDPHFIKKLQDEAYVKGDSSMEDRLRRNSHYIQKRAGASNFMSKD